LLTAALLALLTAAAGAGLSAAGLAAAAWRLSKLNAVLVLHLRRRGPGESKRGRRRKRNGECFHLISS
jgi:hypothetical protein